MKRLLSIALCALALSTGVSPASAEGLALEAAVRLALSKNERAMKAPLRVAVADAQLERARDAFLPSLTAQGSGTLRPEVRGSNNLSTNAGVTLSQPLLNPSAFPQYAQQSHNLESEKWGSAQDLRQLAFDTARAFLQALTAEGVQRSAQRKLDSAELNWQTAKARADAGLASSNDVTRAELTLATSRGQLANALGNVRRAYLNLSFLVGQQVEGPLIPPDNTTHAAQRFEEARANPVRNALERRSQTLAKAEERRPDVRALRERNAGLEASAREPLYRMIPSLTLSGQVRVVPDQLPSDNAVDKSASLNASWQVFDAGLRYADRKQRLAQLESSRLDEKLLIRSVQNEIALALAALRAARGSYEAAEAAASAAQSNAVETNVLYQQGLARAIEVNDANDKQFEADVTLAAAKLAMEQAYLDLRSALGFGPIDEQRETGH